MKHTDTNLPIRPRPAWLLVAGLFLMMGYVAQASISIVTKSDRDNYGNTYSNYNDKNFYTVTYDADSTNGAALSRLTIDLEGGLDSTANWDAGDNGSMNYNWRGSSGISEGQVTLEEITDGSSILTIDFASGYFNPGDVFSFGYDTDGLWYNSNEGDSFGDAQVTVEALWDTGETTTGVFGRDSYRQSTATLDNAVINGNNGGDGTTPGDGTTTGGGSLATTFTANDVVGNRGDNIPFDIDLSGNENTSAFYITGLPEGFRLTEGGNIGNTSWIVDYADIANVEIISPATFTGQFTMDLKQDTYNAVTDGSDGTFGGGAGARAATSSSYTAFSYSGSNTATVNSGTSILCKFGDEGNSGWAPLQDRLDSGFGYFMVANADGSEKVLFQQTLNLGINSEFRVSAFISNITTASMAEVSFRINGVEVVNSGLIDSWDGSGVSQWQEFNTSYTTSSVNTTVTFEIVSVGDGVIALDDIVFAGAFTDDMLVTIHDIGKTDSPIYYTFNFSNNDSVDMSTVFEDTLPSGLVWDTGYEIQDAGGLVIPTPAYSNGNTTIVLSGLVLPPGTTELTMRTLPPGLAGAGDYTNLASITVGGEDFLPQVFTQQSTFTVASAN